ncbi:MAG: hypothetical protein OER96_00805 [Gammaproteobacteria bacterium]|nr:hypothetical protein [Gammaproteobacteria bacterium]
MNRPIILLSTVLSCVFITACVGRSHIPYQPDNSSTAATDIASSQHFEYTKQTVPFENHILREDESKYYILRHIRLPSSGDNGQPENTMTLRYYESKLPGRKGLVIVLPIWGSSIYPPKKITRSLIKKTKGRLNIMWVEGPRQLFDWQQLKQSTNEDEFAVAVRKTTERLQTNVIDIRRLVDWSETQPDIDPQRIGLVGFSISAIAAALVLPHDQRFASSVLVMGAAQPSKMIALCYGRLAEVREIITERFNWTVEEYQTFVEKIYHDFDPAIYAGKSDPENILLIDARNDTCMPESARDAMWHALGKPERISINYGHKTSFLAMTPIGFNFLNGVIVKFLREHLDTDKQ